MKSGVKQSDQARVESADAGCDARGSGNVHAGNKYCGEVGRYRQRHMETTKSVMAT
jgi:hypothetical protein